ncbi:MAG TPA: hypothetical protein VMF61_12320 [Candidatus Acidoferrales bacterium]|nr:hypothetical protein [Candidatus Acidoferrales bacterium]
MTPRFDRLVVLACIAALSGCGGGIAPANAPLVPAVRSASQHQKIAAIVRIVIPRRRHLRRSRYVSPATASIAITVTPAHGGKSLSFNANLTPATNPNCNSSPVTCTLYMSLEPGEYEAAFATFDGRLRNGEPTGAELSANQSVPITIAVGTPNVVSVALDGIPSSVAVVPAGSSAIAGNMSAGFTLSKCNANSQQVGVYGVDAAGNFILGAGAPAVELISSDPGTLAVATPRPTSPNVFTLRPPVPPAYADPGQVVQLTATATPGASSGASQQLSMVNLTFSGEICGVITEYTIPTAGSDPMGITVGPDGAIWFAEYVGNKIGRIPVTATASSPQITEYSVPTPGSRPYGVAAGADGAVWFTEEAGNQIGRLPLSAQPIVQEFPVLTSGSLPQTIVAGNDGALWFTELLGNNIGRIPAEGTIKVTEYPIPTAGSRPFAMVSGPDGALWFVESTGNKIGRIPTSGSPISEYPIATAGANPEGITGGPDGELWFTETYASAIGRLPTGGSPMDAYADLLKGSPTAIIQGPDSALWFAESAPAINAIARMSTDGTETISYPVPTANAGVYCMVLGPHGSIWFTESGTDKIGRLQ